MDKDNLKSPTHKRSSLRNNNLMSPEELEVIKKKSKRHSVNWNGDVNLVNDTKKKLEISLTPIVNRNSEKNKFDEARRRSVHNEFTLVKEFLKKENFEDSDDETISKEEIEKTEKNTKLNVEVGKNMSDNETDENEE
jgi:hypothetical protein